MKTRTKYMRYRAFAWKTAAMALAGLTVLGSRPVLAQSNELALGAAMPGADQPHQSVDGGQASLASLRGAAGTVVVFWSNDCPWVDKYEQRLIELANAYAGQGFGFVLVNSNDSEAFPEESLAESQQRARQGGYVMTYLVDPASELAVAFGATRAPHVFVFDRANQLVYVGSIDDSPGDPGNVQATYLRDALDAIAAGVDVPMPRTKAFGCTIKARG